MGDGAAIGRRSVSGASTDVGRVRTANEDTFLVRPDLGLYLVADGMGGHQAGEIASTMVRLSVANYFEVTEVDKTLSDFHEPIDQDLEQPARRLVTAIRKANYDVFMVSNNHTAHYGMGSTVVAAYVPGGDESVMYIGHVGDSRCYRVRDMQLELLTRDHSLLSEALALNPEMSEEDLARLPANIITRALGMEENVEVDVRAVEVQEGDTYLLCSDGLNGLISDVDIHAAIALIEDASEVCELLIALANDAGGLDNITAVALKT